MPLESASFISGLAPSNPASTDLIRQSDDHIRLIKAVLKATFPNLNAPVTSTPAQLNTPPFSVPVGLITAWYGSSGSVPLGWALCNGQTVNKSDGSGTITLPNLVDKVIVGAGSIAALGADAGATIATSSPSGSHNHTITGGSHSHSVTISGTALTEAQLPAHTHFVASSTTSGNSTITSADVTAAVKTTEGDSNYRMVSAPGAANVGKTSAVGSGEAHTHTGSADASTHSHSVDTVASHTHTSSTIQPSLGLHYIMKV
jgi:microcystin-dependent protein